MVAATTVAATTVAAITMDGTGRPEATVQRSAPPFARAAIVHDDEVGRKWRELSSEHVSEAARVGRERARVYAEFGSPRDSSE